MKEGIVRVTTEGERNRKERKIREEAEERSYKQCRMNDSFVTRFARR